jgi:hypothetical protein
MANDKWLEEIDKKVEEERCNYRGPHCCMTVHYELISGEGVITYDEKFREYCIKPFKSKKYFHMIYCSDCGQKLPESLRNKWFEILKQEYNLEDPEGLDKKQVPKKFLTDEWWNPDRTIINYKPIKKSAKNKEDKKTKLNHKVLHCCNSMDCELLSSTSILLYNAKYREYAVKIPNSSTYAMIDFCPFCGEKLPVSLRDEWFDILEQEYGLESPCEEDKKRVPKEFLTDEWWKKRGL